MALPRWLAQSNRRFVNPGALRRGSWPVIVHTGRNSGNTYRTPIGAEPIDGGYLFFVNYGEKTDWVRNIVAAGSAELEIDGEVVELVNPRLVAADDAFRLLSDDATKPPGWVGLEQCLLTESATVRAARADH